MTYTVYTLVFVILLKWFEVFSYPWLEQISRQEYLGRSCRNLNVNTTVDYNKLDHILVDHNHKFLYCYVPKIACTNWKRVLIALNGNLNLSNLVEIPSNLAHTENATIKLSQLPQNVIETSLNTYTTFLMVRHPFERLLSAYRNKFEDNSSSSGYFKVRYGHHIIKNYRKTQELEKNIDVKFREFIDYIINEGTMTNEHWAPIFDLCYPCNINYTFIGYYETLLEDSRVLLEMIGAPMLSFPMTRQGGTKNKLREYFRELSIETIQKLYVLYKNDFKLFGYSLEDLIGYDLA